MSKSVRWEEFDKILVIQRLRDLVSRWWNIQINFTDEKGLLRGVPEGKFFNPTNMICKAITQNDKGFQGCRGTAQQTTVETTNSKTAKISRCHAGFSALSVPIRIGKKYMGCVFADGFIHESSAAEQREAIAAYLRVNFPDVAAEHQKHIDSLTVLSKKELQYLTELINLVVAEILLVQRDLSTEKQKVERLHKELEQRYNFDRMVGKSAPMQDLYQVLELVCESDATILIQGENGTGKELIARAIHYNSARRDNSFVVVNCGAFNENLLESELFGHVKGAFTGAVKDRKGMFEAADQGTLFLDEIGDTSVAMQVKMLRVLQEGTYTPVGSTQQQHSNVRILAATNKDLVAMVRKDEFREDLYYRLNVINVTVPALRDRREDIPLLIDHFLQRNARKAKEEVKVVAKDCMEKLLNHNWPGNVRELENEIERVCVLSGRDNEIASAFLSPRIKDALPDKFSDYRVHGKLKDALEELERRMIEDGLERTRWNKSRLARELGISRAGLIMKVEKYGLEKRSS